MALYLETPDVFPAFPYDPPYPIQTDLMRHLYDAIESRCISIVESPTGTGKTLSLLTATLTWLEHEKNRARKGKVKEMLGGENTTNGSLKDWVVEQTRERIKRQLEAEEQDYQERLLAARKREELMRRKAHARVLKRAKWGGDNLKEKRSRDKDVVEEDDDNFLPDDDRRSENEDEIYISPELRALMSRVDNPSRLDEETICTKIYYASRTHSQLSQVLPELRKIKLSQAVSVIDLHPSSVPQKRGADVLHDVDSTTTRVVALGSRKQLCINDELRSKARDLDEACRELLSEKGDQRCPYLPPPGEDIKIIDFRDQILAAPKDIEDLAEVGRMADTCPYFGSRHAIPQAELVTLPYNLLLQKSAREALGIDLRDQIVVIDEAHNLIPTLLSLSTTHLPYHILDVSLRQVCAYLSKFRMRLSARNLVHLKRLVVFLDALKKTLIQWKEKQCNDLSSTSRSAERLEVLTLAELLDQMGRKAAGINLLEIGQYLKESKIARKISGYADKETDKESGSGAKGQIPPLHVVEDFMVSLTNTNDDGRVTLALFGKQGQEQVEIKYQLLNPAPNFMDVVDEARSVILAGGTMSPMSDVVSQLFSHALERIRTFSCGHVIPEKNLQALVVTKSPRGGSLEYKADKQGDPNVVAELGQILLNFANVIPAGVVVFFPSYSFLKFAKSVWKAGGTLDRFSAKREVFFEPDGSTDVERVLGEYAAAATTPPVNKKGAILFAVIGAKLSEGLNFSDDLARAVIVIGLPFANLGSPELKERLKYVKQLEERRGFKREKGQKDAAAELYENMCMNSVNQSIGRAIRHKGDWASLILLDQRYASSAIRMKLPQWIGGRLFIPDGFGQVMRQLGQFYNEKR
ncbi:histidine phosphotransfer protein [Agaricus bisporus var. bisporus H97]|uniref:histidine phosphotransfer protein n=1 Tax=Agaricus bisporus var. bisporus (strain H97 / ATCC MYA-4626 / FGSC 10389) TaxID=936046 RepID=UPI00029F5C65|nr:histidine phosphotransfer protein [Agaricus bisporus var. bisporus H97]EKV45825.1 histidine phosphotransfer protein [Agaricus bisporus var. bisporus H97]